MPAISRPLLIALIVAVVGAVGFYATQGARESTDVAAPVVPADEAAPPEPDRAEPVPDRAGSKPDDAKSKPDRAGSKPDRTKANRVVADAGDARPAPAGVPPALRSALRRRQTVVLLLYRPGTVEDAAVLRAVERLRGRKGVAVFTAPIDRLGRFRGLVRNLPVTQPPAVVIVDRKRRARVVEGYVDPATLAQDLADAR